MPGDYTRFSFNPFEDHFGVLMQQGRVMLDADFNEWVEILGRQLRVRMLDTVGRCIVPNETPNGFRIQIAGPSIKIGPGRAYVHGLLADNHGTEPFEWDQILEEMRGKGPVAYGRQPYLPNAAGAFPMPAGRGHHLVYLDVWQRELTHVQEPDLIEKAVGVDTATRVQTVWQVKVLADVPADTTCATPDEDIPGWLEITRPSAGRLTTAAVGVPESDDPCIVAPAGGFRGTENRLYRVEVHTGGPPRSATFKWSRDNASVKTLVTGISAARDVLTVSSLGRDDVRRFAADDWIEIVDDHIELAQKQPGAMRKVQDVDEVNQTITLDAPLDAGMFDELDPASRHTRVRRWDQKGEVLDATNAVVSDVDANGGVIPVAAGGGTMVLEDGVQVTFTEDPNGGAYRIGDYWVFAARTVDASVEELDEAPPRGIHHHYCRLALVTFPREVDDCRTLWPPDFGEECCWCTECVTAESHNSGNFTIQMAIDRVRAEGGKVCLGPGLFDLGDDPVRIDAASSVQIEGHGWRTILFYRGDGGAIQTSNSIGVDLSSFSVASFATRDMPNLALTVQNSLLVRVEHCLLAQVGLAGRSGPAVGLGGMLGEVHLRDNLLFGGTGIASLAAGIDDNPTVRAHALVPNARSYTATVGLGIDDNVIAALDWGIRLDQLTLHLGETRISGNRVFGARQAGVATAGIVLAQLLSSSRLDIKNNDILATGIGIAFTTDNTRVIENDVGIFALDGRRVPSSGHGILAFGGLLKDGMDRCQILSNRITGVEGDAIRFETSVASAMVKQNVIKGVAGGGIVMDGDSAAGALEIENNQLMEIASRGASQLPVAGIRVLRAEQVALVQNTIDGFALAAVESPRRVAIEVIGSRSVRVSGNDLRRIGPPDGFRLHGAGIEIWSPFERVDVFDNSVRRSADRQEVDDSTWHAILIRGPVIGPIPGTREAIGNSALARRMFFPLAPGSADGVFLFMGADHIAILVRGSEIVGVRGNLLEGYGSASAAQLAIRGSAVFSDNRSLASMSNRSNAAVVEVSAGTAIVSGNHVERSPSSDDAVALAITVPKDRFTLPGNICLGGVIRVEGDPPPDPWPPLNVVLV